MKLKINESYDLARPNSTKLLAIFDEGQNWEKYCRELINYLSDDDVKDFAESAGWFDGDEELDESIKPKRVNEAYNDETKKQIKKAQEQAGEVADDILDWLNTMSQIEFGDEPVFDEDDMKQVGRVADDLNWFAHAYNTDLEESITIKVKESSEADKSVVLIDAWGQTDETHEELLNRLKSDYNISATKLGRKADQVVYKFTGKQSRFDKALDDGWFGSVLFDDNEFLSENK